MITVQINKDIFDNYEATFTDPIRNAIISVDFPADKSQHEAMANKIRAHLIEKAVKRLREYQVEYINYITKYRELKTHTRNTIKHVNHNYHLLIQQLPEAGDLPSFASFVYENLFPLLALFKPDTKIYARLLQFIENESFEYSGANKLPVKN